MDSDDNIIDLPPIKLSSILKQMTIRNWNFAFHLIWHWSTHVPKITKIWGGHMGNFSNIGWFDMEWPGEYSLFALWQ